MNDWTARELLADAGDEVEVEYYLWDANAGLTTRRQTFRVGGIVPITGLAADRQLAPEYPGISGAESLADWDPPFPIDLSKVRPIDEKYWDDYRVTPKAFIQYEQGRELWRTRYGGTTSLRFSVPAGATVDEISRRLTDELRASLRPELVGVAILPVREQALAASAGATDFGEYFTYFSFFLVVSALLLAVLFFRLGVEQRLRQIGVLRAAGFSVAKVRRLLLIEAVALATVGGVLGAAGAIAYGYADRVRPPHMVDRGGGHVPAGAPYLAAVDRDRRVRRHPCGSRSVSSSRCVRSQSWRPVRCSPHSRSARSLPAMSASADGTASSPSSSPYSPLWRSLPGSRRELRRAVLSSAPAPPR